MPRRAWLVTSSRNYRNDRRMTDRESAAAGYSSNFHNFLYRRGCRWYYVKNWHIKKRKLQSHVWYL